MTKFIFLFMVIFSLSSCYQVNKSELIVPDVLISESQMVEILTEVQIAEAGFGIAKNRNKASELKPQYYNKVLQLNGITLEQLKENLDYYQNYPEVLEEIYNQVLANLSKMQSEVLEEKKELEEKRIADSISMMVDSIELMRIDSVEKTRN